MYVKICDKIFIFHILIYFFYILYQSISIYILTGILIYKLFIPLYFDTILVYHCCLIDFSQI